MKFKYRVKGKVEKAFIIRGLHFAIDSDIDFCITENELVFVKGRCRVDELIDLSEKKIDTPEPVLEVPEIETKKEPEEVKNELQSKPLSGTSKAKPKAKV